MRIFKPVYTGQGRQLLNPPKKNLSNAFFKYSGFHYSVVSVKHSLNTNWHLAGLYDNFNGPTFY